MTEQTGTRPAETDDHGMTRHSWKRRGLIAAAWAAVAAIVARQTTEPVEAGVDGDVVLGADNTTTMITSITNTSANAFALDVACTAGPGGFGLSATGSGFGVIAENTGGTAGGAGEEARVRGPSAAAMVPRRRERPGQGFPVGDLHGTCVHRLDGVLPAIRRAARRVGE